MSRNMIRCVFAVVILAASVLTVSPTHVRADSNDLPPKTQDEIKKEKLQHDESVENAKIAVSETQKAIEETEAKIRDLEDQPTPSSVGDELKRPDRPVRGNDESYEDYSLRLDEWDAAVKKWYGDLSEEDQSKWDKAIDDAANLKRKRSQLERWKDALELHNRRAGRVEARRKEHCTNYPLGE